MSRLLRGQFLPEDFEALCERAKFAGAERRAWLDRHLRFPLFPEPSTSPEPEEWLRDYLATYLEKDIQSLASLGNVTLFRASIRQLAARVGTSFKYETAAQELGTTSVTLRKYLRLLEQTLNLLRLPSFAVNPVQRVIKAPKLYLRDNGLLWALRGYEDERLLAASGMLGAYAEQAAIVEFAKWCSREPTAPELRFWSKTEVSEVDLVISNRGYHIPIEIKLAKTFEPRWLRGLDAFEADHRGLKLEIPYRLICHFGEPQQIDARTFALPLWLLV
jgi:predicted AAA+ superfamily ATPase